MFIPWIFLEYENLRIYFHEIVKKKSEIKVILHVVRKLVKELHVIIMIQKVVFVIEPSVIKVLFNFNFKIVFDELTSVESFKNSEEFS